MEKLIAERIAQLAGVSLTPVLEKILVDLLRDAKEGHFCCRLEDPTLLPRELYSEGKDEPFLKTPLVLQGNRLYLQRNWALETLILKKVSELLARVPKESSDRFKSELAAVDGLQEAQRRALFLASEKMFSIFSGGPGTGKTFTAGCFIRTLAASKPLKVAIAAPTGKAAAHLEHAVKSQGPLGGRLKVASTTLHRLLRLQPGMQRLSSTWTIDADLVVVDEASMLDGTLLLHLLNAIGPNTRLLLLGDPEQLPPVEGGGFFAELADLFGQKLERSMRMGNGGLLEFSQDIQKGTINRMENEAVCWLEMKEPAAWIDWLIERLPHPIFENEPLQPEEQKAFQVLCALRQGPLGSDALNQEILARYEKNLSKGQWLVVPIIIVQNDPQLQLYNGTTGVLVRQAFARHAVAYFDGEKKIVESDLPRYEVAFCLSVHKSQGSEYGEVVLLFPPGSESFGREALYTGATRAKKKVNIAIDSATLESALKNTSKKRSGFRERFKVSF